MTQKICNTVLPILVLFALALILFHPINPVTADIGRHIKNGSEILAGNLNVLKTNFYSYVLPDYPTLNHHWLSGVVFYLIWKTAGFAGLHLFFILIMLATVFIFLKIAAERSSYAIASITAVVLLPLILERGEIRPEIFTGLFAAVFFLAMVRFKAGRLSKRQLLFLPVLEMLWINLHIYFFLGFAIVGAFFIEALIEKSKQTIKTLGMVILAMLPAVFINPFGLKGVLAPFDIFKNYGYDIVENKSIFYLENLIKNPNFLIFKILFGVLLVLIMARLIQNRRGLSISDLILAAGFGGAALFALRNLTLFALFALPIASACVYGLIGQKQSGTKTNTAAILVFLFLILSIFSGEYRTVYQYGQLGLGLLNKGGGAAEIIKSGSLVGPIFNNYDIGGYLIFYLPADKKVFVDNRPEAYPANFFKEIYIPMQTNKKVWDEQMARYGFKTVIFSIADHTPWGQTFLNRITKDPDWKTVFFDSQVIILVQHIK